MVDRIKIYDVDYPVKFGKGAIEKYCNSFDPPMGSLEQFITHLRSIDYSNMSFKLINDFALLLQCGIEMGTFFVDEKLDIKIEVLSEWLLEDINNLPLMMGLVTKSLPQAGPDDKKKAEIKGEVKK